MNRPAIDDLLGSILSTWYELVAEWMPPGQLSSETCGTCDSTALAFAVDISRWPHDLMHQLAMSLEGAILTITESLETETDPYVIAKRDEHLAQCPQSMPLCVRDFVIKELTARTAEIEDVLEECVSPRLDEWISSQARGVTPHLRG